MLGVAMPVPVSKRAFEKPSNKPLRGPRHSIRLAVCCRRPVERRAVDPVILEIILSAFMRMTMTMTMTVMTKVAVRVRNP